MPMIRTCCLAALLPGLLAAGCGGGGGSPGVDTATPPPNGSPEAEANTYGKTNLPGRLLVDQTGNDFVVDLRTGARSALPQSARDADADHWAAGGSSTAVLRYNTSIGADVWPVSLFDARTFAPLSADLPLPTSYTTPLLAPDARSLLTFWYDEPGGESVTDKQLTVFDLNGDILKRGSQLDGELVFSKPAAWLPDGRYVYLAGNALFVSSPDSPTSTEIATLPLANNDALGTRPVSTNSSMSVSPDGKRLAFSWREPRKNSMDSHLWVVNIDGTGLRKLTAVPDPDSPLDYSFGNPAWSPDGAWVAGVFYMQGTSIAPDYPQDEFSGWQVIGTTGCDGSQVFVLPATADKVRISWPAIDATFGIKVRNPENTGAQWLTTCGAIAWLP